MRASIMVRVGGKQGLGEEWGDRLEAQGAGSD